MAGQVRFLPSVAGQIYDCLQFEDYLGNVGFDVRTRNRRVRMEFPDRRRDHLVRGPLHGHAAQRKAFRRTAIRAGLDPTKVIPHTMRHTAITNLIETGAHARTVQQVSGHKSLDMAMRYTHARQERVDEALEKMERAKTEPVRIGPRKVENF
jgi:site-specific recombinase XerD